MTAERRRRCATHVDADIAARRRCPARGTDTTLMGMLLFIASEVMFFAALFGAYFNVKATAAVWPPQGTDFIHAGPGSRSW